VIGKMKERYFLSVQSALEFMNHQFQLEDVHVHSWRAIERKLLCAMLAFAFLAWYLGRLLRKHKRQVPVLYSIEADLDPDAKFLYYRDHNAIALACGFAQALTILRERSG